MKPTEILNTLMSGTEVKVKEDIKELIKLYN